MTFRHKTGLGTLPRSLLHFQPIPNASSPTEGIMLVRCMLSFAVVLACALPSHAQVLWRFQWKKGQELTYKIKHSTSVMEVLEKGNSSSDSNLDLVNRWQVTEVDDKGIATLTLTLVAMRNEQKRGNGDTLLFDSQNPDKSTPELAKQMGKFIGQTLSIVRMDGYGRVLEVTQGSKASYE